jgi:hypothetical protein
MLLVQQLLGMVSPSTEFGLGKSAAGGLAVQSRSLMMLLNWPFRPSSHIFTSHQPDPELYLSIVVPVSLLSKLIVLYLLVSVATYNLHDIIQWNFDFLFSSYVPTVPPQ